MTGRNRRPFHQETVNWWFRQECLEVLVGVPGEFSVVQKETIDAKTFFRLVLVEDEVNVIAVKGEAHPAGVLQGFSHNQKYLTVGLELVSLLLLFVPFFLLLLFSSFLFNTFILIHFFTIAFLLHLMIISVKLLFVRKLGDRELMQHTGLAHSRPGNLVRELFLNIDT